MDFDTAFGFAIADMGEDDNSQSFLDLPTGDYALPQGGILRRGTGQTSVTDLGPGVRMQPAPISISGIGSNLTMTQQFDPWAQADAELDFEDARSRGDDLTPYLERLQETGALNRQPELSTTPFAPPPVAPVSMIGGEIGTGGLAAPQAIRPDEWMALRQRLQQQYPGQPLPPELEAFQLGLLEEPQRQAVIAESTKQQQAFDAQRPMRQATEDYAREKFETELGTALFNSPQREKVLAWKKMTAPVWEQARIDPMQITPADAAAYLRATLPAPILKAVMDKYRAEFPDVLRLEQAQAKAETILPQPETSRARGLLNAPIRETNRAVQGIAGAVEGILRAAVDTTTGNKYGQNPTWLGERLGEMQRKTREFSKQTSERFAPSTAAQKGKFYEPLNVIETALGQVPQLAVLMTTGGAGGLGMIFAMEAGAAHDELFDMARKRGYSEAEANKLALLGAGVVGATNTALERLGPFGEFVAKNRPIKTALVKALRGARSEGLTEMAQETVNVLAGYGLKVSQPQAADIARIFAAGLGGAVVGGGTGLGQGVYDARQERISEAARQFQPHAPTPSRETPFQPRPGGPRPSQQQPTFEEAPTEIPADIEQRIAGARRAMDETAPAVGRQAPAPEPFPFKEGEYTFEDAGEAARMTDRDLAGMARRLQQRIESRPADAPAGVRQDEQAEVDRIRRAILGDEAAAPAAAKPLRNIPNPILKDAAAVGQWYARTFNDPDNGPIIEALASTTPGGYTLVDVPVSAIDPNSLMAGDTNEAKVSQIAKLTPDQRSALPPILAIAGPQGGLMIADGTHRLEGRKAAGDATIKAYIPESLAGQYQAAQTGPAGPETQVPHAVQRQEEGRTEEGVLTPETSFPPAVTEPVMQPPGDVVSPGEPQPTQTTTTTGAPTRVQDTRIGTGGPTTPPISRTPQPDRAVGTTKLPDGSTVTLYEGERVPPEEQIGIEIKKTPTIGQTVDVFGSGGWASKGKVVGVYPAGIVIRQDDGKHVSVNWPIRRRVAAPATGQSQPINPKLPGVGERLDWTYRTGRRVQGEVISTHGRFVKVRQADGSTINATWPYGPDYPQGQTRATVTTSEQPQGPVTGAMGETGTAGPGPVGGWSGTRSRAGRACRATGRCRAAGGGGRAAAPARGTPAASVPRSCTRTRVARR